MERALPRGGRTWSISSDVAAAPIVEYQHSPSALLLLVRSERVHSVPETLAARRKEQSRVDDATARVVPSVDHDLDVIGRRPD
jgi:hypothetical protein